MATDDFFIVAIELGSSKVTGLAGKKQPDGSIQVLAKAQEKSSSFIRKGVIYNIDKTAQCITSIITTLQKSLNKPIGKVYVGIGGQGVRGVKNSVLKQLETETAISQELVDSILDSNLNTSFSDKEILDVIPQEYKVGTDFQIDPVGILSDHIEGRFLNIIARSSIHANLAKCFVLANIEVAEFFLTPTSLAESVLTDAEKRSGCALVDFGADTTTVAVYKNNLLRHLSVIPLGGSSITKDIMTLQIDEDEAEELKMKYGAAYTDLSEIDEEETYMLRDGRTIERRLFCDIIEARTEEILVNVTDQIHRSGFGKDTLLAGMIITGGAANIRNLDKAITNQTGFDKLKFVKSVLFSVRTSIPDLNTKDGILNTAFGLLVRGTENCCASEEPMKTPSLTPEEIAARQREMKEAEDKKKKEEEEKRKEEQAEAERLQKEEEKKEEKKRKREEWKKNNIFTRLGRKIKDAANNLVNEE